jgi:hypothetical protein
MLTRLTEGEPANRVWLMLVDKTYAPANLARAFEKGWANDGGRGSGRPDVGALCCNGSGMDGAKGSERPITAGITNDLPRFNPLSLPPPPRGRECAATPNGHERPCLGAPHKIQI